MEDEEAIAKGELPKRKNKRAAMYKCGICGEPKAKITGHSQLKGKWFCPQKGQTLEEWKEPEGKKTEKKD